VSDFLSRLGARHLGESAILPRALSRFETGGTSFGRSSGEQQFDASAARFDSDAVRRPAFTPTAEMAPPTESRLPQSPAPTVSPQSLDTNRVRADEQKARGTPALQPKSIVEQQPTVPVLRTAPSAASLENSVSRHAESIVHRDSPSAVRPVVTTVAREMDVASSRRSPRDHAVAIGANAPREPDVVHVHIGRVEVRAVQQPAERALSRGHKAADAGRPLSLDRYLRAKDRP